MPLFEFKCHRCNHSKEVLQRYNDPSPRCDMCELEMKRQVSRTSFALKGDGWYKDHYGLKTASQ
tara:strand:- start:858 stop:1049 length:192 start_codon:yes stop_codon:yes gene_type:complete